jgi:hypothetical protein
VQIHARSLERLRQLFIFRYQNIFGQFAFRFELLSISFGLSWRHAVLFQNINLESNGISALNILSMSIHYKFINLDKKMDWR